MALRRAAGSLQNHFGLPVAAIVAYTLWGETASAYQVLLEVLRPAWYSRERLCSSAASSTMWFVYGWIKLSTMALACAAISDTDAATGVILLRTSAESCDRRCPDLAAFLQWTTYSQSLSFSAAGFFNVDRSLLVNALAVIITYVVILGQITPSE
ncbi:gustatory receptor 68a-like [Schistocerca nitens]|uniref:gustatory receptor 68a-like n=1 Tax=Schistocerca nitens TaxID=7011 RepID=UPI002117E1D6|nr:gustatory receptor 68a-like [Schistocerca nitens]